MDGARMRFYFSVAGKWLNNVRNFRGLTRLFCSLRGTKLCMLLGIVNSFHYGIDAFQ
jgi:nicotinamide riboside transporter PnuC